MAQRAFMKFLSMFWKRLASWGSIFTMSPPLRGGRQRAML